MKKLCLIISAIVLIHSFLLPGCAVNRTQDTQNTATSDSASSLENTQTTQQETLSSDTSEPEASPDDSGSTETTETEASEEEAPETEPSEETIETEPSGEEETIETEPEETEPPVTQPAETTAPETTPPATEPPATEPPVTEPPEQPPENPDEYIGTLYNRGQLFAMDNTLHGYGPGRTSGGARPGGAVRAQNAYGQYGAYYIAEDTNVIYLTFDCGYEYNNLTASILDTLKEKDVKAVFFVTMYYVETNPHLVQRMIDEGHIVGNHSNNHFSMPTLSVDEMAYEIMSLHEYMLEKFGYEMHLFRPPKGEYSTRSLAVTQSLGYTTTAWSFAYADWNTGNQPAHEDALALITGSAHNGAIYLLHAVSATNAAVLADVIDNLRGQGYSLELFGA